MKPGPAVVAKCVINRWYVILIVWLSPLELVRGAKMGLLYMSNPDFTLKKTVSWLDCFYMWIIYESIAICQLLPSLPAYFLNSSILIHQTFPHQSLEVKLFVPAIIALVISLYCMSSFIIMFI